MLTHLHIKNFTLVDTLDLEFTSGLSVITGESGAGKSIVLDALAFTLGDKADGGKVRHGCPRAEITASFDIEQLPETKAWLNENDLLDGDECILRRILTQEGRSRAYINGHTVTQNQLRTLGEMLIDLHRQHAHQSLLKAPNHRRLLDEFGGFEALASQVLECYREWEQRQTQLTSCHDQHDELNARFQLLRYQVEELDKLDLREGEISELEQEQNTLAHAEEIQHSCAAVHQTCSQDEGLENQMHHAIQQLQKLPQDTAFIKESINLLNSALIHLQEARHELEQGVDEIHSDPARLVEIEARLSAVYDIARKHHVKPEELPALHHALKDELNHLQSGDQQVDQLSAQVEEKRNQYRALASELSEKRTFAAMRLSKAINEKFQSLSMEHAKLEVTLENQGDEPKPFGQERVEFLVTTNPGQPARPLVKVASGGELSRISLAIQVVTAQTSVTPTLIFDEVDVGIGGTTGDIIGAMLRELGKQSQILCITHLAQVASKSHQHFQATKVIEGEQTNSLLKVLDKKERVAEIARMMGGTVDSKQSLAHAREMLKTVQHA